MNRVELKGTVANSPHLSHGPTTSVTFVRINIDGSGTCFLSVKGFDGISNQLANMQEGDPIHIVGRLQNSKNKEGRWETSVVVEDVFKGDGEVIY